MSLYFSSIFSTCMVFVNLFFDFGGADSELAVTEEAKQLVFGQAWFPSDRFQLNNEQKPGCLGYI